MFLPSPKLLNGVQLNLVLGVHIKNSHGHFIYVYTGPTQLLYIKLESYFINSPKNMVHYIHDTWHKIQASLRYTSFKQDFWFHALYDNTLLSAINEHRSQWGTQNSKEHTWKWNTLFNSSFTTISSPLWLYPKLKLALNGKRFDDIIMIK
jgi:hypothetical protein